MSKQYYQVDRVASVALGPASRLSSIPSPPPPPQECLLQPSVRLVLSSASGAKVNKGLLPGVDSEESMRINLSTLISPPEMYSALFYVQFVYRKVCSAFFFLLMLVWNIIYSFILK